VDLEAGPQTPRPLRADARRNRERIVDAARDVFTECGATAQMDDIAKRAGVGVGTVYRHFPTKSALIGELMAAKFRHHSEVARRWAAQAEGWVAFEGFLRETFEAMARDATLQQRMMWASDPEAIARSEAERQVLVEVVGAIIDQAHARGELRPDFTVDHMPALMSAAGAVVAGQGAVGAGAPAILEILVDGLRTQPVR
jgi:AcrR family transcriptional regulator